VTAMIEVRRTDDGAILARRLDGKPLTPEDREEAKRKAVDIEPGAINRVIDETVIAVLIDSEVLGHPIWFAFNDTWRPDEGDLTQVCYASELTALRTKSAEELRSIFTDVKLIFRGGMVRQ
jgi:hypothetical protein